MHNPTAQFSPKTALTPRPGRNVLLVHPTGNQFVRHLLEKLSHENRLALFATTLGFAKPARWSQWLPAGLAAEIGRRSYFVPANKLTTQPWKETIRLLAIKSGVRHLVRHEAGWASVDAVYRDLDHAVAANLTESSGQLDVGVVYGYEDGCAETFEAAEKLGLSRIYDLPIAHWKTSVRLLHEEAERWPDWEPTLGATADTPAKLERKNRELELADLIVCPSDFVADSIPSLVRTSKRVIVAPFGSPSSRNGDVMAEAGRQSMFRPSKVATKTSNHDRKLRVLFAGSMSQRKGLADVFAAMQMLRNTAVELIVMGAPILPISFYREKFPGFIHEPPRPHAAVLKLMQTCDVLVLPSIIEGRALVMQEAMSQGLPIIITRNTGGGDLVEEGKTGFLTPIRSPETIARHLEWLVAHQDELPRMRNAAKRKAAEYTWEDYARRIFASLPISTSAIN